MWSCQCNQGMNLFPPPQKKHCLPHTSLLPVAPGYASFHWHSALSWQGPPPPSLCLWFLGRPLNGRCLTESERRSWHPHCWARLNRCPFPHPSAQSASSVDNQVWLQMHSTLPLMRCFFLSLRDTCTQARADTHSFSLSCSLSSALPLSIPFF